MDDWDDCPDFDDCPTDFDDLADWDADSMHAPAKKKQDPETIKARAVKSKQRIRTRRAEGEAELYAMTDWHLEDGYAYHTISGGDIDFLTYVRKVVKEHRLDYLILSTWYMAMEDAEELADWLRRGMVKRADVYVGEIFIQHYAQIFDFLKDILPDYGGRLCMQRNHAKVACCFWPGGGCAITSSANINTNPRIEQTVITVDKEVAEFYKSFFDDLKPKNTWSIPWYPAEVSRCPHGERTDTFTQSPRTRTARGSTFAS